MRKFVIVTIFLCLNACANIATNPFLNNYTNSAGFYFPSDKKLLEELIIQNLQIYEKDAELDSNIFGIISPHAGYNYSGIVAGAVYKQIEGMKNKTVIILSNSHYFPLNGIAIYPFGSFETPLGKVQIDENLSKILQRQFPFIKFYYQAFDREHPIDNQIPFLQFSIKNLKILPLVIGKISSDEREELSSFLANLILNDPSKYLIVASSDMSHYFNYSKAQAIDTNTIKKINLLDVEGLSQCISRKDCELCGTDAVLIIMGVTKKLNGNVRFLKYLNSGDTVGDKNSVVGYSAYAFYLPDDTAPLNHQERKTLLKISRKTLERYVLNNEIVNLIPIEKKLIKNKSVYITFKKDNHLRGCMGSLRSQKPLYENVISTTIDTASKDYRFASVKPEEVKDIIIEITVIGEITKIKSISEIEIGKHGLYLCKNLNCAVFLPQVAVENNWDREEFLKRLSLKAGLPPSSYQDADTEIYVFTAQVFSEEDN